MKRLIMYVSPMERCYNHRSANHRTSLLKKIIIHSSISEQARNTMKVNLPTRMYLRLCEMEYLFSFKQITVSYSASNNYNAGFTVISHYYVNYCPNYIVVSSFNISQQFTLKRTKYLLTGN